MSSAKLKAVARKIRGESPLRPRLALVLGSGFGAVAQQLEAAQRIPYAQLPGFPPVGVTGHAGELCLGRLGGTPVMILSGRAHYYEGHSFETVTWAVRTVAEFGIRDLLLTNAAGGINRNFRAGDFMVVTDHINWMGANPLRGPALADRPQFVDLSQVYDPKLSAILRAGARAARLKLKQGVYLAVSGPSYETPAEIGAFARLGADAVGMSTVPEAIVARQCGLRVAGLSCITNLAAGISRTPLDHAEVLETASRVQAAAARLLTEFARRHGREQ